MSPILASCHSLHLHIHMFTSIVRRGIGKSYCWHVCFRKQYAVCCMKKICEGKMKYSTTMTLKCLDSNYDKTYFFLFSYNLTDFYIPSFDNPDFVCAVNGVPGMQTCISEFIPALKNENRECTLTYEGYINQSRRSNNSNNCINWNQYYTVCRKEGDNPSWGAIGFDNIFIAWVAIFQVCSASSSFILEIIFSLVINS